MESGSRALKTKMNEKIEWLESIRGNTTRI
jgi:hypothetical protein